jgi:hypothetical protein
MRNFMVFLALIWMLAACSREEPVTTAEQVEPAALESEAALDDTAEAFDKSAATKTAKQAILLFAGELQMKFSSAMRDDGPVSAIEVCNTQAMAITERVSAELGLSLGRVSLQNRNPNNSPNEWQTSVMLSFQDRHASGEDLANISWSEVAGEGEDREFRYMKPIPTHAICLDCHGTSISPDVRASLDKLYPEDMATGFRQGDIRGAFVVTSVIDG